MQVEAPAHAQAPIAHLEAELFDRIRLLEAELAHGLPPQLTPRGYENLVRTNLANIVNPLHYWTTLSNEIF